MAKWVRILLCGCLISYKTRKNDMLLARLNVQTWSFYLKVANRAEKLQKSKGVAFELQNRCGGCIYRCRRRKDCNIVAAVARYCICIDCFATMSYNEITRNGNHRSTKEEPKMKENRVNEMMANMKSFSKDKYQKAELLTEMFALQDEIVELTFKGETTSTTDMKIWDAENHLEQLNQYLGNVADEELKRFKEGSKRLCNLIKAEISGNRGEAKAFRTLQYIQSQNIILKNVELSDGDRRTELDAVVVTPGAITIVEVKNTAKNIFIDENGDYYRTGEFLRWDCNIAEKMNRKEELLRKALENGGIYDVKIKSVVVFTNNRIEVQNKYSGIRTCFISQLAHIIDEPDNSDMDIAKMEYVGETIRAAGCKESYPFDFDVVQYKKDFATLMLILEEAANNDKSAWRKVKNFFTSMWSGKIGRFVAAVTFIPSMAVGTVRKEGVVR